MSTTTQTRAPAAWPRLKTAELAAANPVPEPDAELTASVQADGICEPLYVTTATSTGAVRVVDGLRRLAAAAAAGLTDVPVTHRPVIRTDALTAHPGNARRDLNLSKTFLASIRAEGVRVPVKVTTALRVVDGHRRLAGAVAEGLTHVPYEYDERDEAGQYLDMVSTSRHREGLTDAEEAAALFAAAELGAGVKRLATASGRTQKEAKTALTVAASGTARQVGRTSRYSYTLDALAQLAEIEADDPEAAERITAAVAASPDRDHSWTIARAMTALEHRREAETHRAELETKGARIRTRGELSEKATPVHHLTGVRDHHSCQGEVWVLEAGSTRYTRYCANPPLFGHATPQTASKPTGAHRKRVIAGNIDWGTAERLRRQWLTELITRKTHPKTISDQFARITARLLLEGSDTLARLTTDTTNTLLAQLLGQEPETTRRSQLAERADTAPRRNAAHAFAAVAAAHEAELVRSVWRMDGDHRYHPGRATGRRWLTWLSELGYQLTPIETALHNDEPYDPDATENITTPGADDQQ